MLPLCYDLIEYINDSGKSSFTKWFNKLDANAAYFVTVALNKMENGNLTNTKFLSDGVWEFKIHAGPGYRVYFSKIRPRTILLLCGGSKRTQRKDIKLAIELLQQYNRKILH